MIQVRHIFLLSVITISLSAVYTSAVLQPTNYNAYISDWGVTQMKFKTIKYTWSITNYSTYDKLLIDHLESPIFPADEDDNQWQIQMFLKDLYNGARNMVSVFIMPLTNDKIDVKYKLAFLNKDKQEVAIKTAYSTVHRYNLLGYSNFATKDYINSVGNKLLPNDVLTVVAEIVVPIGRANISGHCRFQKSNDSHSDNFLSLLENELFSDVKISIGNHEFPVHRAILASVSPVFLALFKGSESVKSNVIKIIDVDPQIFRELLRFIYTGKVQGIEKIGKDLLPVAEKYGIKQLKILCEEALCRNITTNSAIDLLVLAENNEAENLKVQAANFITANELNVLYSPSYKALVESSHPLLKIFRAPVEKSTAS